MISFIVIGINEGWKLSRCIESIIETMKLNSLVKYEIIYVDSNSSDDSIERVKGFLKTKIFKLTGDSNAAIARNVGADAAVGEILFFLDGDMEINKEHFFKLFDKELNLKYDFISGDFENNYYSDKDSEECIYRERFHKNKRIKKTFTTGGLFAIKKEIWFEIGGMRDCFGKGEDMDLGLRLSSMDVYLHRLPIPLVKHHTVSYHSKVRLWGDLADNTHLFGRSLLYRRNIMNPNSYRIMVKQDYSFLILIISIFVTILTANFAFIMIYPFVLILRTIRKKEFKYFFYYLFRDVKVFFGVLFFYPKNNKVSFIGID